MANKFTNFKFTTEGKDTLTEVLAAKGSIAITQVYTFATKLTDALVFTQLSSLGPKQIKPVGTVSAQSNTVETRLQIDNADLTSDYNLQGIALVGTFNKTNFVLGYINTNEATNVPAFSGNQVQTIALDVSFAISDTSVITINTQTAGMLTVADYNALVAFIKDQVAPLSVDKKVVHLTNNEIIDGIKTFKQKITGSISGNANTVDYINIHQITANIDLNTLTTNGNYLSTLETKTTSNKPGGTSEQYTLISTGNIQVFNDIKTDKTYIRNYIKSDTFTSWKVVIEDIDQTLNAQFNFTKVPTVNSKPVAIQADLQTETTNRTNADKTINNSLSTEVSDRKSGDTINANAIQAEATARSQADSSAAAALNTEKTTRSAADTSLSNNLASEASARSAADVGLTNQFNTVNSGLNSESVTRSAADATLTKAVSDIQKQVQTETTNRTNAYNKIDSAAVHKIGNESISGVKTFSDTTKFSKQIEGAFSNRTAPFSELSDLITKMATYAGQWRIYTGQVSGLPIGDNQWGVMEVIPYNNSEDSGLLLLYGLKTMDAYIGYTSGSTVQWEKIANDAELVHLSGNETLAGTKTFSSAINGNLSGNASTADKLRTARTIGGVSFDGGSNINLPGVNTQGNQNTTGNAASATKLQVARKVNGTAFDGTKDISVNAANDSNLVHQSGNESISGYKTFNNTLTVNGVSQADWLYKHVATNNSYANFLEVIDDSYGDNKPHPVGTYFTGKTDGSGVTITGNGLTGIGGGESINNLFIAIQNGTSDSTALPFTTMNAEHLIAASDGGIYFMTNQQSGIRYDSIWRLNGNGYWDRYDASSSKWINVIPNNSGSLAQDAAVVHNSGNETISGTKSFSSTIIGSVSGNAGSATKLQTARSIGGVSFDGSANINLPGVNTTGNQSTSGNAGSATKLATARTINGTKFDGTANISINAANDSSLVHQSGNESIAGNKTFTGTLTAGGTQLTDSGWKSLTPSVGGTVKYRKVNGIVYVQCSSIPSLNNEGKTLVTLPAGYRPNDMIWTPWYAGNNIGNMTINSDGSLTKASTNNPGKDQVQISLFVSYPADN
ncbi:pyocin knob domain-containing protein [Weissella paramesenteroides]|uniref:pyocin knob domain-containing protein n=1 Tax=Weissella paramesenteroides TaxID=1249 RepID=UPI0023A9299F|nr:pyocin knob domain-containing protein [Weissella paramesenteroides]WEA53390.1 pyocin knob domain-containing protein [Weissella paramesenteroides]